MTQSSTIVMCAHVCTVLNSSFVIVIWPSNLCNLVSFFLGCKFFFFFLNQKLPTPHVFIWYYTNKKNMALLVQAAQSGLLVIRNTWSSPVCQRTQAAEGDSLRRDRSGNWLAATIKLRDNWKAGAQDFCPFLSAWASHCFGAELA